MHHLLSLPARWRQVFGSAAVFLTSVCSAVCADAPRPHTQIDFGITPLMAAAYDGDAEKVKTLLGEGADPNASDILGDTALIYVVYADPQPLRTQIAIAQLLLDAGAKVNARGLSGDTVLHEAVIGGRLPLVKFLLNRGADVNVRGIYEYTPLMRAAYSDSDSEGSAKVVKALLAKGAQVNAKNDEGVTPLMLAAQVEQANLLRILLHAGADVNAADAAGKTALLHAAECLIQAPIGKDAIQ